MKRSKRQSFIIQIGHLQYHVLVRYQNAQKELMYLMNYLKFLNRGYFLHEIVSYQSITILLCTAYFVAFPYTPLYTLSNFPSVSSLSMYLPIFHLFDNSWYFLSCFFIPYQLRVLMNTYKWSVGKTNTDKPSEIDFYCTQMKLNELKNHDHFYWPTYCMHLRKNSQLQVFMAEGPNSRFSWNKGPSLGPSLSTLLTCYVAMESRKVIMCTGMKLYSSAKAHIQVW